MNGDSAEKLVQALQYCFPGQRKTFIFGASSDHPIHDMLRVVLPVSEQVFMVASRHPRAATPAQLATAAAGLGGRVMPMSDVSAALSQALVEAGQAGLVCVTGSLFLVADVREVWLQQNGLPLPPIDPMVIST
jgi:dihydrofolate synthase/folylpolyglutamate synthase